MYPRDRACARKMSTTCRQTRTPPPPPRSVELHDLFHLVVRVSCPGGFAKRRRSLQPFAGWIVRDCLQDWFNRTCLQNVYEDPPDGRLAWLKTQIKRRNKPLKYEDMPPKFQEWLQQELPRIVVEGPYDEAKISYAIGWWIDNALPKYNEKMDGTFWLQRKMFINEHLPGEGHERIEPFDQRIPDVVRGWVYQTLPEQIRSNDQARLWWVINRLPDDDIFKIQGQSLIQSLNFHLKTVDDTIPSVVLKWCTASLPEEIKKYKDACLWWFKKNIPDPPSDSTSASWLYGCLNTPGDGAVVDENTIKDWMVNASIPHVIIEWASKGELRQGDDDSEPEFVTSSTWDQRDQKLRKEAVNLCSDDE